MGQTCLHFIKIMFLGMSLSQICAAEHDITVSVFTVTSKSMTVRWSGPAWASSYKVTATPKNSPEPSVFAQFSGSTVMGSVNSLSPNTVYTMRVEAMDSAVNILSSAETEETTAPDVPSIEKAYSKQSNSITVEFGDMPGATGYILRAQTQDGFFSETSVGSSPGTVLNLQPYTNYTLSVMSTNSGGRSQPSLPVVEKTVVAAPALNSSSPSNDTIVVDWEPVDHAVLYTLCIIRQDSATRLKLNTTDTSMTFSDLEPGTTYCIKGTAWDPDGNPGDDLTVCQITRPPIPADVQLTLTAGRSVGLVVDWHRVQGAENYYALSSTGQNCTSSDSFCIISPLTCGQNHTITVTAKNQAGPSDPSSPEDVFTFPCPPEFIWVEEPQPGNCSVMWSEVLWVDYYIAYVKRDDGAEEYCNTTSTTCHFHCLCGYTYLTTVFAYNQAGPSPLGPVVNYTTIPCCPEDVSISLVSTETLEISWTAVRGAELYETMAADQGRVIQCNDTAPVCALSDLSCDTLYSIVVKPCSDIRGCNYTCIAHTHWTAPCAPQILNVTQTNSSTVRVLWSTPNGYANYTVSVLGRTDSHTCRSMGTYCDITHLPCGTIYEVSAVATTSAGRSLPSYSVPLETGPCCPASLTVEQVTQAMTNVTWSASVGARSYITSVTSAKGHAKCHTMDTHCLMGCITCGTNYSVSMEAFSMTGHRSQCSYHGFSSSACCPSSVRLYRMPSNALRVYWRSTASSHNYTADLNGTSYNYTCSPSLGATSCDVSEIVCGEVYTVVVAPITQTGSKVTFCPRRLYSVSCSGNSVGMVIYRGRRSVE